MTGRDRQRRRLGQLHVRGVARRPDRAAGRRRLLHGPVLRRAVPSRRARLRVRADDPDDGHQPADGRAGHHRRRLQDAVGQARSGRQSSSAHGRTASSTTCRPSTASGDGRPAAEDVGIGDQLEIIPDYHDTTTFRHDAVRRPARRRGRGGHPAPRPREAELADGLRPADPRRDGRRRQRFAAGRGRRRGARRPDRGRRDAARRGGRERGRRHRSHRLPRASSTSTSTPRPPSAATARSGVRSLQGVTTHLTAPDGFGWAPLPPDQSAELWRSTAFAYGQPDLRPEWPTIEAYLDGLRGRRSPINVVPMAPHQAIRFAVLGWDDRAARRRPRSTGCAASPATGWRPARSGSTPASTTSPRRTATTDELIELARVVARVRRHLRRAHALQPGRASRTPIASRSRSAAQAGIPIRLSHESVDDETEPLLDEARRAGVDFGIDWYLYPAGSSHLLVWLAARGPGRRVRRDRARA